MSQFTDPQQNPYDPYSGDDTPETKPIDEIIRMAVLNAMMKMRVHLPGQIVKVHSTQKVDIQPLLKTRYTDGTVKDLPVLQNVMVGMPMGADYSIKLPIAVGDTGHILFCDRSLAVWSAGDGQAVDPQDNRLHDINDPVFIPGLVPFSQQIEDSSTDMVLTNGQAQIRLAKDGKFKIENLSAAKELITILVQLLDTLANDTFTMTMMGPQPFIGFTISKLNEIKADLEELQE